MAVFGGALMAIGVVLFLFGLGWDVSAGPYSTTINLQQVQIQMIFVHTALATFISGSVLCGTGVISQQLGAALPNPAVALDKPSALSSGAEPSGAPDKEPTVPSLESVLNALTSQGFKVRTNSVYLGWTIISPDGTKTRAYDFHELRAFAAKNARTENG